MSGDGKLVSQCYFVIRIAYFVVFLSPEFITTTLSTTTQTSATVAGSLMYLSHLRFIVLETIYSIALTSGII